MAERGACTVLHSIAGTNHGADVAPAPAQFCREGGLVEEIHEGWVEYEIGHRGVRPDAAASAYFHTRVADVVLGLIDKRPGFCFGLHLGADGSFEALDQIRLFGLLKPGFDLCVITVLLLLVPHFAKQKLSLELFPRKFLDELHQAGFRLHKGFEPGIDFGVEFKLADQFFFVFW
jgi:hypothetical protein